MTNIVVDVISACIGYAVLGLIFLTIGFTFYSLYRGFRSLIAKFKGN
jgi:hypothetical protein